MSNSAAEILVIASPAPRLAEGGKGIYEAVSGAVKLNTATLQNNISTFLESVNQMLGGIPNLTGPYKVDEIELKFEINAEGSVQLIGGVKTGATGGITLRLKK